MIAILTFLAVVAAGVPFSVLPASRAIGRQNLRAAQGRSRSARWPTGRWLLGAQAAKQRAPLFERQARDVLSVQPQDVEHVVAAAAVPGHLPSRIASSTGVWRRPQPPAA